MDLSESPAHRGVPQGHRQRLPAGSRPVAPGACPLRIPRAEGNELPDPGCAPEEDRSRPWLQGLALPSSPSAWELRAGAYRVFYDVSEEERTVYVRAVRKKPAGMTTEEIL